MKVTVDFDLCASTGSCMQICPEVFEVRSDGYLYILQDEPGESCDEGPRGRRPVPDGRDHRRADGRIVGPMGFHDQLDVRLDRVGIDAVRRSRPRPGPAPRRRSSQRRRRRGSSAGRSSTPPPTSSARSSRRSPTSPSSARNPQLERLCDLHPRGVPRRHADPRRQARRHRLDGRALRPRGVRPVRRPRRHGQPVPRHRLGRALLRPSAAESSRSVAPATRAATTSNRSTAAADRLTSTSPTWSPTSGRSTATAVWSSVRRIPDELAAVREAVGDVPILVPGVGAQGGDAAAAVEPVRPGRPGADGEQLADRSSTPATGDDFAEAARASSRTRSQHSARLRVLTTADPHPIDRCRLRTFFDRHPALTRWTRRHGRRLLAQRASRRRRHAAPTPVRARSRPRRRQPNTVSSVRCTVEDRRPSAIESPVSPTSTREWRRPRRRRAGGTFTVDRVATRRTGASRRPTRRAGSSRRAVCEATNSTEIETHKSRATSEPDVRHPDVLVTADGQPDADEPAPRGDSATSHDRHAESTPCESVGRSWSTDSTRQHTSMIIGAAASS